MYLGLAAALAAWYNHWKMMGKLYAGEYERLH